MEDSEALSAKSARNLTEVCQWDRRGQARISERETESRGFEFCHLFTECYSTSAGSRTGLHGLDYSFGGNFCNTRNRCVGVECADTQSGRNVPAVFSGWDEVVFVSQPR